MMINVWKLYIIYYLFLIKTIPEPSVYLLLNINNVLITLIRF